MKKITLLLTLLATSIGLSQNIIVNGEFTSDLSSWSTYVADFAGVSASYNATNSEANITNITGAGGATWHVQLNQVLTAGQIASLTVGQSYKVSFTARSSANGRSLKLFFGEDGGGFAQVHGQDFSLTTSNVTYESSVFTVNATYGAMKLGFEMGLSNDAVYLDNVTLITAVNLCTNGIQDPGETGIDCGGTCAPCPAAPPSVAAPTQPTRPSSDVISLFSNDYTNINVTEWSTGWDQADITDVQIAGNDTKKINYGIFLGIQLGSSIDLSTFTHMHFDYWITDELTGGEVFNPKLSNHAMDAGETSAIIYTNPTTTSGQWVSFDVPLADFAIGGGGSAARNKINQILLDCSATISEVYVDNIYFHKNTTLSNDSFNKTAFSLYPNPTQNSWTVKTQNVTITSISVFDMLGKQVLSIAPNTTEATIEGSSLKSGLYFAQIKTASGISSLKLVKK